MYKTILSVVIIGLFLASCAPPSSRVSGALEGADLSAAATAATATATETPVASATGPEPALSEATATATPSQSPTPEYTEVGLPAEQSGTVIQDFVAEACQAQWFTQAQKLPCPGDNTQADNGYVQVLNGQVQGFSSDIGVLLTYPPQKLVQTISGMYPAITVKKGDRFRAVLDCRAHSACDVEFVINYTTSEGSAGLKHWRVLFADGPVVVDYPLDAIAGETVQLSLAVYSKGYPADGYAVWIAPHVYRPASK
jgi:hypothetical protein